MSEELKSLPQDYAPRESSVPVVTLRSSHASHPHPWVYRRMLKSVPPEVGDGDEVAVVSADDAPLGRGFYHTRSQIAVRLLSADPLLELDEAFLRGRIESALALRRDVLRLDRVTNAYRLVHAEADGLSGLIVDRYGGLVVVEFYAKGFYLRRALVARILLDLLPDAELCLKVNKQAAEREDMDPGGLEPAPAGVEVEIHEGKMRFLVSPSGHKTGFFLDQRDNRQRFASLVRERRVLDAFSYTGGFALAARTLGKAAKVVAIDLDEDAVAQAKRNAALNRAEVEWLHGDALVYLRNQRHAAQRFDAVVVDPPKWALTRARLEEAERRYLDVNTYACRALARGGILLTCSCSGLVSEGSFLRLLRHAASRAERQLQVFHIGGAAGDHPVALHVPESRYLKAVFARVL
jgi:23S rRNA (cytosine1962-C5)-methyltransferase